MVSSAMTRRPKKSRRFRRLLKLITGRRQTEWTGATRCPNEDDPSHKPESLIDRKRTILFSFHFPYRPLAECLAHADPPAVVPAKALGPAHIFEAPSYGDGVEVFEAVLHGDGAWRFG